MKNAVVSSTVTKGLESMVSEKVIVNAAGQMIKEVFNAHPHITKIILYIGGIALCITGIVTEVDASIKAA